MNLSSKYHTIKLLGVDVFALRMDEVIGIADRCIADRQKLLVGIVNVAKIVNIRKDAVLHDSLIEADVVLADGMPLVWLSRMLGTPLPERITGIDLMFGLLKRASEKNYSVYFLGAKPQVVEKVVEVVKKTYPGLRIAGYSDGYFSQPEERNVVESINKSSADILFVAISPPKKEIFLKKWRGGINVPICHGVGGSFDIIAGITKRAPIWMQKLALEWFYRLIQEPRRMWKRYLVTNVIFIKLGLEAVLRAGLNKLFRKSVNVTVPDAKDQN